MRGLKPLWGLGLAADRSEQGLLAATIARKFADNSFLHNWRPFRPSLKSCQAPALWKTLQPIDSKEKINFPNLDINSAMLVT